MLWECENEMPDEGIESGCNCFANREGRSLDGVVVKGRWKRSFWSSQRWRRQIIISIA